MSEYIWEEGDGRTGGETEHQYDNDTCVLKSAINIESTPTIIIVTVTFMTLIAAFCLRSDIFCKYRWQNTEPAPRRSESELDIVAEITPENKESADNCRH